MQGLDYNTQRERLLLPEYGREIQKMVEHAVSLPLREDRQRCANTIVKMMAKKITLARDMCRPAAGAVGPSLHHESQTARH